jgi:hypothetical protein
VPTSAARGAPISLMPGANGASQGVASIEVDGAAPPPQLSDDTEGFLRDLERRGVNIGAPGCATLGDVAVAPGVVSVADPGVFRLLLQGSPGFPHPPIDWRRVGDDADFTCSWVATVERMLHETLASVNQNILRPIRASL